MKKWWLRLNYLAAWPFLYLLGLIAMIVTEERWMRRDLNRQWRKWWKGASPEQQENV